MPEDLSRPLTPEQEWMKAWRSAAVELPKIRAAEIRAMADEEGVELALMLEPFEFPDRASSGLVELQGWFKKVRESGPATFK